MNPHELEPHELQAVARSFMDKIEKVLGPTRDIPAPDVGTNAQTMAWLMDEYGKLHGHTPACVTGKPIALEGSYGREAATGRGRRLHVPRGGAAARPEPSRHPLRRAGLRQRRAPGRRGSWPSSGRRMVGVSDASGAIRSSDGIDPEALVRHLEEGGRLPEFEGAEAIDPEELLEIECDVFIPAALGGHDPQGRTPTA